MCKLSNILIIRPRCVIDQKPSFLMNLKIEILIKEVSSYKNLVKNKYQ